MIISKLGPEPRGREFAGGGGVSLVRSSVNSQLPRTVGREERQGGKARKRSKSLCSSFWKRTLVEPRETPDSLQRARHYSLGFPSLRNLETGPQPAIASSSQTAPFNLCKSNKKKKKKAYIPVCLLLTHRDKMSV